MNRMVNGLFTVSPSLKGCGSCCRHCSARMHWIECQSGDNHSILKKEEPTCVSASPSLCSSTTLLQYISALCAVWWWWWWPDPSPPRSEWVPGQAPRAGTGPGKKVTPAQPRAAQRAVRVVGPRQRSCEHSDIRQHVTVTTTTNVPDLTSEDSSQGIELSTNPRKV